MVKLEKDLYSFVEDYLIKNKFCIPEYVGNELSFGRFRTDVFGVFIDDEGNKRIYLLEGKLFLDGRNNFSKVISETSYLNNYADYIYIFGKVKDNFDKDSASIEECRDKGIGILCIDDNNEVHEFLKPKIRSIPHLNKKEALFRIFNKNVMKTNTIIYIADFILQATYEYNQKTSNKCAKFIDIYNALFPNEKYKDILRYILGGNHKLNERGMRGAFERIYGKSYYIRIINGKKRTEDQLCVNDRTLEKIKPPILLD